jgi:hypothetical protein
VKSQILAALRRAERLLEECGWNDRAEWFRTRRKRLEELSEQDQGFKDVAREIHSVLVGMGSFSDVPMYPQKGSALTRAEARAEQWELVEEMGTLLKSVSA